MNPLHRKMFRQPGMSRQPAGILASSPELSNVVRQRMGQPVQMANGGQNVTNYMSAIRDLAAKGDKATLNSIATDQRLPRSVQMAAANALSGRSGVPDQIQAAPVSDADRMAANRANLGALRSTQGLGQGADLSMSEGAVDTASAPVIDARSNLAALRAAQGLDQGATVPATLTSGIGQVFDELGNLMPEAATRYAPNRSISNSAYGRFKSLTPRGIDERGEAAMGMTDDPYVNPDGSERLVRDPVTGELGPGTARNIDAAISERLTNPLNYRAAQDEFGNIAPDGSMPVNALPGETLASTGTETETESTTGGGTTEPEKKSNVNKNKLNDLLTQVQGNTNPDEVSKSTPKLNADEAATPEAAEALKLTLPEESSLSDMEAMAKKIMGFDPSKSKESKRDSFWRNLTMSGLAIAAGESGNALTNVAKGLMVGMDSYGKDIKDINAQEAEERKEYRATLRDLIKTDKDSAIAMATMKNNHAYRVEDLNQRKDQFESTQAFQREKLKLDTSLTNKSLEVQITTALANMDLKEDTLNEAKKQNVITNTQNALKNMEPFQKAAVGLEYLVLDAESGEYEWTDEGQAWIDTNANAILAASVTGSNKTTDKDKDAASIKEQYGLTDAQARIVAATQSTLLKDYGNFEAAIKALGFNKPAAPQKVVVDPSQLKSK